VRVIAGDRPATTALTAVTMRAALRHSSIRGVVAVAVAAGAVGASVPVGFRGLDEAAGVTGGLHYGLLGAAAVGPLVAVVLTTAISAGADDRGLSRELFLAGVDGPRRMLAAAVAGIAVSLLVLLAAPAAGAIAGLGDALRRGSTPFTEFDPSPLMATVGPVVWFGVVTAAVAAIARRRLTVVALLTGGAPLFFVGLILSRDVGWARDALAATPYGPFWSMAYHNENDSTFTLEMSALARTAVLCAWPLALGTVAAYAVRRPPR
jgi:hypothetical protein